MVDSRTIKETLLYIWRWLRAQDRFESDIGAYGIYVMDGVPFRLAEATIAKAQSLDFFPWPERNCIIFSEDADAGMPADAHNPHLLHYRVRVYVRSEQCDGYGFATIVPTVNGNNYRFARFLGYLERSDVCLDGIQRDVLEFISSHYFEPAPDLKQMGTVVVSPSLWLDNIHSYLSPAYDCDDWEIDDPRLKLNEFGWDSSDMACDPDSSTQGDINYFGHTIGNGLMHITRLCQLFSPTGYKVHIRPEPFGPQRFRRAFGGKPFVARIDYERLFHIYRAAKPAEADKIHCVPLHHRRRHPRHLWKRAGISLGDLPRTAAERDALVVHRGVKVIDIKECWVGAREFSLDGMDYYIDPNDQGSP